MNLLTLAAAVILLSSSSDGPGRVSAAIEYTTVDRAGTVTTVSVQSGDPSFGRDLVVVQERAHRRHRRGDDDFRDFRRKQYEYDEKLREEESKWRYEQDKLEREFEKKWRELDKEGYGKRRYEREKLQREFDKKRRELDDKLREEESKWRYEQHKLGREYEKKRSRR